MTWAKKTIQVGIAIQAPILNTISKLVSDYPIPLKSHHLAEQVRSLRSEMAYLRRRRRKEQAEDAGMLTSLQS